MKLSIANEEDRLSKLSISELRLEYERVSGEVNNSRHRGYLIKRILWQMQANVYGGLSEAAIAKAKFCSVSKQKRTSSLSYCKSYCLLKYPYCWCRCAAPS